MFRLDPYRENNINRQATKKLLKKITMNDIISLNEILVNILHMFQLRGKSSIMGCIFVLFHLLKNVSSYLIQLTFCSYQIATIRVLILQLFYSTFNKLSFIALCVFRCSCLVSMATVLVTGLIYLFTSFLGGLFRSGE